jgi:hypothetical protein
MSKLIFAGIIPLVGLMLQAMLRRRADSLPPGLRTVGPHLVLLLAIGVPALIFVKGEAEATYNARVAASRTQPLIQQQYLSKWDGRLPQFTFGGNTVPLVQLPAGDGARR